MDFWNAISPPSLVRTHNHHWRFFMINLSKSTSASFPLNLQVYARSFASYVSRLRLSLLDNFLNVFTVSDRVSLQPAPFFATGPIFWKPPHFLQPDPFFNPAPFLCPCVLPTSLRLVFVYSLFLYSSLKVSRHYSKTSWGIGIFSAGRLSRCHSRYNRLYRRFQGLLGFVLWHTCFEKRNWVGGFPPPPPPSSPSTSVGILWILVIKVLTSSEESDKYEQAHRFLQLLDFGDCELFAGLLRWDFLPFWCQKSSITSRVIRWGDIKLWHAIIIYKRWQIFIRTPKS